MLEYMKQQGNILQYYSVFLLAVTPFYFTPFITKMNRNTPENYFVPLKPFAEKLFMRENIFFFFVGIWI